MGTQISEWAAFYPGADSFTVQIIIGQAQLEEALQLASVLRCETFLYTLASSPKDGGSLSPQSQNRIAARCNACSESGQAR
jgi:hypothetical protein